MAQKQTCRSTKQNRRYKCECLKYSHLKFSKDTKNIHWRKDSGALTLAVINHSLI